jgi:N4-gp56 family major capsid protein
MGRSVSMARYDVPAVNANPLNEGMNPAERQMVPSYFHGTVNRFGEVITISREEYDLHPLDTLSAASMNMIDLVKSTQERIRYNAAKAGSQIVYNSSAISSLATVNGVFTAGRIQRAIRLIHDAKGRVFADAVAGQARDGTRPIEPSYYVFCSTKLQPDIRAQLPGFKTCADYPTGKGISEFEFGSWQNTRWFTSQEFGAFEDAGAAASGTNLISSGGTDIDVFPIIVVAKDALTSVPLKGTGVAGYGNIKPKILDKADKSDPTNALIKVAADWYDLCMRTNEGWLVRVLSAATDNPS